jgi:hypothetical protein
MTEYNSKLANTYHEFTIKPKYIIEEFKKQTGINLEKLYKSILNILKNLDNDTLIILENKINKFNFKGGKKRKTRKSKRKTRKSKRKTRKYGGGNDDNDDDNDYHPIDINNFEEEEEKKEEEEKEEEEKKEEEECFICLETLDETLSDLAKDKYKHTYTTPDGTQSLPHYVHEVCLNNWIKTRMEQHQRITCPLCREEISQEDVNNILNKYRDNNIGSRIIRNLLAIIYLIIYCTPLLSGMFLIVLFIYTNQHTGGSNIMEKKQQNLLEILNELIKHKDNSDTSEIEKLRDFIKQQMTQN